MSLVEECLSPTHVDYSEKMERHRCKICLKKFANGRALGGHMRSHMLNHAIASAAAAAAASCETVSETESPPPSSVSQFLSSRDSEHEDEVEFASRDNDEFVVVEPTGSSSLVTLQDRESETESFMKKKKKNNPIRKRRSKRILQKTWFDYHYFNQQHYVEADPPAGSSITEVTSDQDLAAFCLMMMSRDKWNSSSVGTTINKKYKCDTCNKSFRSYQALGGHRASHKKIRFNESDYSNRMMINKFHQCPICLRVFASGQALGGHKRSHNNNSLLDNTNIITPHTLIDLNLPASLQDQDLSAVSHLHF